MDRYGRDVLRPRPRRAPVVVEVAIGDVVEDRDSGFCGAVVGFTAGAVELEDRHGARRLFPLRADAFLIDGRPVTLSRAPREPAPPARTASGSVAVGPRRAQVAKASRIWVEGVHDAALVERVWGDDLRIEGVVVEPLSGVDNLAAAVREFTPGPGRRLGVLVDHLVNGSKESRIARSVESDYVLVTGHPYVDIWQAVKPTAIGITAWPEIPVGQPWKEGICAALGRPDLWRDILSRVDSYRDLETPLINAVERLIDHVTAPQDPTDRSDSRRSAGI